ncbi:hypothetical protein [Flavobacterium sp.]|uniref:hypothetical protein n=1 Tax=Flavobacterium sp. TaxID=239 RepID=UPI00286A5218|nr:hypothetical protein [Flavobacterium sp.]
MSRILVFLFIPFLMNGQQDILGLTSHAYKATSNITNLNEKSNVLDIGVSYELRNKQTQVIYNLTNKYFLFGTYNDNNSTSTYKVLFGDEQKIDIINFGYSIGFGIQKIAKLRKFENTELLFGCELQKFRTSQYSANYTDEKDFLEQNYSKIFAQFNIAKARTNFDFGYSLKLSYFIITSYSTKNDKLYFSNLKNDFTGKSTFMLDPTLNFNYKLLKNKQLLLTSQIGFSSSLWTISDRKTEKNSWGGESSLETYKFYFSPILKFGIQYRFNLKKENYE